MTSSHAGGMQFRQLSLSASSYAKRRWVERDCSFRAWKRSRTPLNTKGKHTQGQSKRNANGGKSEDPQTEEDGRFFIWRVSLEATRLWLVSLKTRSWFGKLQISPRTSCPWKNSIFDRESNCREEAWPEGEELRDFHKHALTALQSSQESLPISTPCTR